MKQAHTYSFMEVKDGNKTVLMVTIQGECKPLTTWADAFGLTKNALYYRLKQGWSPDRLGETVNRRKTLADKCTHSPVPAELPPAPVIKKKHVSVLSLDEEFQVCRFFNAAMRRAFPVPVRGVQA